MTDSEQVKRPEDKVEIPERWKYEHLVCGIGFRTCIEELGAAEKKVEILSAALQQIVAEDGVNILGYSRTVQGAVAHKASAMVHAQEKP